MKFKAPEQELHRLIKNNAVNVARFPVLIIVVFIHFRLVICIRALQANLGIILSRLPYSLL
uniref:Uncharacterized protein n=1 Tax=Anguilla anguilla TaxID=7936 RepID=A0A0E9XMZ0_ANGAN